MTKTPSPRRKALVALAIVLGCAACCAIPILAAIGAGSAFAGMAAALGKSAETIICVSLLGAVIAAGFYFSLRKARKNAVSQTKCESACSSDASCCDKR